MADDMPKEEVMGGQRCMACGKDTLELRQREMEVPYFGKVLMFSMTCPTCKFHKSDIDMLEKQEPSKYTFEIESEDDLSVRIIKSGEATVKLPFITTIEPGMASQGYITNVEGLLNRIEYQLKSVKENAEDEADKKKAKNLLKKIFKIKTGQERQKLILEDPSGNSAIISDKAKKEKLKGKK